jgi:hypothetical protein
LGGFNSHLVDSKKPEISTSTWCGGLDEFINNLDELLLPDLALQIKKMSVVDMTSTHDAPELVGSNSNRSEGATQSRNTRSRQVRTAESVITYILYSLFFFKWWWGDLLFGGGPCPPLYSLGGQIYMKILIGYKFRSPTWVLFGLSCPTSLTTVWVILLYYEYLKQMQYVCRVPSLILEKYATCTVPCARIWQLPRGYSGYSQLFWTLAAMQVLHCGGEPVY